MNIKEVIEFDEAAEYIVSRWLLSQYKKAKRYILDGHLNTVDFKLRQPKSKWIYQFKINQKYRGFCYLENNDETLVIFKISDHQD